MAKNPIKELMDLALHPVRMRVLTLLAGSDGLTPLQMAERMRDIPQASLYRHINRLAAGGLIAVAQERPVRGTVEKVYALNRAYENQLVTDAAGLDALNRLSHADHLRYFMSFVMSLLDDYSNYLNAQKTGPLNLAADGVGYHKLALFLSDEEFAAFAGALNQAIVPYLEQKSSPQRRKRYFTTIMMPAEDNAISPASTSENKFGSEDPEE